MSDKKSYSDLLRDPRWQRKRLEIMQRDGFACAECGSADKTLNVHHRHYARGRAPWEYDNENLVTLCEDCHVEVSKLLDDVKRRIGKLSRHDLEALQVALIDGYPNLKLASEYFGGWPHIVRVDTCSWCGDPDCVTIVRDPDGSLSGWCPLFELALRGDEAARSRLKPMAASEAETLREHVEPRAFQRPESLRRLALARKLVKGTP